MRVVLNRNDVLKLIDAGEICKDGMTITLEDSRQEALSALSAPASERVDLPIRPRLRTWAPAREAPMRKGNPLKD